MQLVSEKRKGPEYYFIQELADKGLVLRTRAFLEESGDAEELLDLLKAELPLVKGDRHSLELRIIGLYEVSEYLFWVTLHLAKFKHGLEYTRKQLVIDAKIRPFSHYHWVTGSLEPISNVNDRSNYLMDPSTALVKLEADIRSLVDCYRRFQEEEDIVDPEEFEDDFEFETSGNGNGPLPDIDTETEVSETAADWDAAEIGENVEEPEEAVVNEADEDHPSDDYPEPASKRTPRIDSPKPTPASTASKAEHVLDRSVKGEKHTTSEQEIKQQQRRTPASTNPDDPFGSMLDDMIGKWSAGTSRKSDLSDLLSDDLLKPKDE